MTIHPRAIILRALLACMLVSPLASAESLAGLVGREATQIRAGVERARAASAARPAETPAQMDANLIAALQLWTLNASRLAADIDRKGGPSDLGCIFRGMAQDAEAQMQAASAARNGAGRAAALGRISLLLRDAAEVAPQVDDATHENAAPGEAGAAQNSCRADPTLKF